MSRAFFTLLSAVSAVLCIAACVLWVRSYFYAETLHWYGDRRELSLMTNRGSWDGYRVWGADIASKPTAFTVHRNPQPRGFGPRADVLARNSGMWHAGQFLGF